MNDNLYFIVNSGCDAETYGLMHITDDEFPKFKNMVENLNKNSYYGCMPVISVYKISMDALKETNYNPDAEPWDDDFITRENVLYLDDKIYTFVDQYFNYYSQCECVIDGSK